MPDCNPAHFYSEKNWSTKQCPTLAFQYFTGKTSICRHPPENSAQLGLANQEEARSSRRRGRSLCRIERSAPPARPARWHCRLPAGTAGCHSSIWEPPSLQTPQFVERAVDEPYEPLSRVFLRHYFLISRVSLFKRAFQSNLNKDTAREHELHLALPPPAPCGHKPVVNEPFRVFFFPSKLVTEAF